MEEGSCKRRSEWLPALLVPDWMLIVARTWVREDTLFIFVDYVVVRTVICFFPCFFLSEASYSIGIWEEKRDGALLFDPSKQDSHSCRSRYVRLDSLGTTPGPIFHGTHYWSFFSRACKSMIV